MRIGLSVPVLTIIAGLGLLSGCAGIAGDPPPGTVGFSDTFSRADGELGNGWITAYTPVAQGGQVVSSNHYTTITRQAVTGTVRVAFDFTADTDQGFEAYVVVADAAYNLFAIGCDGGAAGRLVFRELQTMTMVAGPTGAYTLVPGQTYRLALTIDPSGWLVAISSNGAALGEMRVEAGLEVAHAYYGMSFGRSGFTHLDDFTIEQSNTAWTEVFRDGFDLGDGSALDPAGWQNLYAPRIAGGRVRANDHNAAARIESSPGDVRVGFDFEATATAGKEAYITVGSVFGEPAWAIGCDGGLGGRPVIRPLSGGVPGAVVASNSTLIGTGIVYHFQLEIVAGTMTFTVSDSGSHAVLGTVHYTPPGGLDNRYYGFVLGRGAADPSYLDNFSITPLQ